MSELKPCPFCGGEATLELIEVDEPFTFTDLYYTVICTKCGFRKGRYRIPKLPEFCEAEDTAAKTNAIAEWNRREGRTAMINELKILEDGTLIIKTDQYDNVKRVLVEDGTNGTLYYADESHPEPIKEPPVVGIYRNCSDISWCCEACKYDSLSSNDYPCRMCTGDTFNAFEPIEGWAE